MSAEELDGEQNGMNEEQGEVHDVDMDQEVGEGDSGDEMIEGEEVPSIPPPAPNSILVELTNDAWDDRELIKAWDESMRLYKVRLLAPALTKAEQHEKLRFHASSSIYVD